MDAFALIAERRILEAMRQGAFDDLPGRGKPLKVEDFSGVPEELRMGYKILKNAGCLPPELQLQQELVSLRELLERCSDEEERKVLKKRLTEKQLHYQVLSERNRRNPAFTDYRDKLEARFGF